jgi:hypothetical protein
MARKVEGAVASFTAGADLSAATLVNTLVGVNSSGNIITPTTIVSMAIGTLLEGGVTGQNCSVQIQGIAKVVLGGTIASGVRVGVEAASGKAIALASTAVPVGTILVGGAEDELGELLIGSATAVA